MGITIRYEGEEALKKRLEELSNVNFDGASMALAEALRSSTVERFKEEKDPEGHKWQSSIRAEQDGGQTLSVNGDLKNSIKSEAASTGYTVGTNLEYAATHQFGDEGRTIRAKNKEYLKFCYKGSWRSVKAVTVNIPARPFLGISEEDMQEIKGTLEDLVKG